MADIKRPGFVEAWLSDLQEDIRRYGKRKLLPWFALSCLAIGASVPSLVSVEHFWDKPEVSLLFFTAVLTLNGLLLALSWGSFAKIYEIASEPKLAAFLRLNGLLNSYIFHVDFIHLTQLAALCLSGFGLILSVVEHWPALVEPYVTLLTVRTVVLAGSIATSIYALKNAVGAVRLMQDLVWYSAHLPLDRSDREITVHEGGRS